ncbi:MAG: substrate-binding domain-containing protein [Lachnospiraceae bacterium]|nr:substrate-binding domain-containing protein [Lachnospiraceae bacterium]
MGKQLLTILLVIALFAAFNFSMYMLLTCRLANNFSDTSQAKMIDVGKYLPHEADSDLVRIESSLKLKENLPVLDGAAALLPVYAAFVDAVYPEGSVTYEGGEFSDDNYYGENFAADSKMQYKNTVRGYQAIVDGTTDVLFCAAPSEAQKQYAAEKGVELVYVPIGLEAFVFFVNENNPVDDLTVEQIRGIYAGEYTNWSEVGGANRVINPVTRLSGSGSQSAMDAFMGDREIGMKSPFAVTGASIGFSFRYYMDGIVGNQAVKMLALNGVYPSAENIRNGTYPIIAQFYAIYRADNTNENIPVLIDWILSEEGQTIIEKTGYVRIK